jgi:hypothetical protein
MVDTVFVNPNTQLPSDIQVQVVVGKGSYVIGEEILYKSLVIENLTPENDLRESLTRDNANILELYIVNGLANKS